MNAAFWKHFLLAALFAVSLVASATAAAGDVWQNGSPVFFEDGPPRESKPILLYFTAKWCGFCQQMQRTTLAESEVLERLGRLRSYKLDFDTESLLAKKFGVSGIPAFVLTNDRGDVIDRLTGARSAPDFLAWLAQAEAEFVAQTKTAAAAAEALRTLPTEVRAADVATRARAVERLWSLAGRAATTERAVAAQILTTLVSESGGGAIWRTGLGNTDLAVRVAAANLLLQISNGKRIFDPWGSEAERTQSIAQLGFKGRGLPLRSMRRRARRIRISP